MTIVWELMVLSTNSPTDEAEAESQLRETAKAIITIIIVTLILADAAMI